MVTPYYLTIPATALSALSLSDRRIEIRVFSILYALFETHALPISTGGEKNPPLTTPCLSAASISSLHTVLSARTHTRHFCSPRSRARTPASRSLCLEPFDDDLNLTVSRCVVSSEPACVLTKLKPTWPRRGASFLVAYPESTGTRFSTPEPVTRRQNCLSLARS